MSDRPPSTPRPPWRPIAQKAARAAAVGSAPPGNETGGGFNYRWEHVQATVRLAVRLAELTGAEPEVVEAAAWLHDVAKGPGRDHGREGAIAARRVLACTDLAPYKVEGVADAISKHVGLVIPEPVQPLEAAVLWDADKLTKLGATGVLLHTAYRVLAGQGTLPDLLGWLSFPVMEGVVGCLHTAPARAAGRQRLRVYEELCRQAVREFDGDDLMPQP